ncbi:MAG: glycosyltransferase [Candidatus Saccharimonadales bacterium]
MEFLKTTRVSPLFLILNMVLSVTYFIFIALFFKVGNPFLFALLIIGEVFHLWQVFGYIHSVWPRKRQKDFDPSFKPNVAVYITVCGEPTDIVEETVKAVLKMDYPTYSVYILNDGFVANRDNWKEAEVLADKYGIKCLTRKKPGGAKAGNINHALSKTKEPFVVIFDADHVPKHSFLAKMMGYFTDEKVAFVQSPQYYKNHNENMVTGGAWDQQALFFGAILQGKDSSNTAFMCGTNMILRRKTLLEAGGMSETSIAEDFLTSLLIHEKGGKSIYVGEVLAEGLAPEDFLSYYKQQFRWARGSLEVVFRFNPFFRKSLTLSQRIQYLSSASFYLSGLIVFLNAVMPLIYFYSGLEPLSISTMTLALIFLPYIFIVLYTIQLTSNFSYTFRALSFSLSSFPIHIKAVWQILTGKKSGFVVTSKKKVSGNHGYLVTPHLVYIALAVFGVLVGFLREGFSPSIITNATWVIIYIAIFVPFISAAFEKDKPDKTEEIALAVEGETV